MPRLAGDPGKVQGETLGEWSMDESCIPWPGQACTPQQCVLTLPWLAAVLASKLVIRWSSYTEAIDKSTQANVKPEHSQDLDKSCSD